MAKHIEVIHTAERDPSINLPYAPAIKVTGGSLLFLAGVTAAKMYHQHPHIPEDFADIPASVSEQTRLALENIRKVLEACRATFRDVVQVTRYLTDIDEQDQLNEVWWAYFGDHRPGTATIEVTRLAAHPKLKVELSAIAVVE
ncbi:MAG TPA: RidA family protein [Candidatus Tectomicrobia bacterium]|nr:RidA family protein [Candidatus Tectomicrobia bacterium]